MLASVSPYFQAMFTSGFKESHSKVVPGDGGMQEILLEGVSSEALGNVLEYIYSGKLELSPLNIQSVLFCASQLQVDTDKDHLSRFIQSIIIFIFRFSQ